MTAPPPGLGAILPSAVVRAAPADAEEYDIEIFELGLLGMAADHVALRAGARYALGHAHSAPLAAVTGGGVVRTMSTTSLDDLGDTEFDTPLLAEVGEYHHACVACRMGPRARRRRGRRLLGRVLGVGCVRVIDASILPVIPRTATHPTTVAAAHHLTASTPAQSGRDGRVSPSAIWRSPTIGPHSPIPRGNGGPGQRLPVRRQCDRPAVRPGSPDQTPRSSGRGA